jgi:hypothetical protein
MPDSQRVQVQAGKGENIIDPIFRIWVEVVVKGMFELKQRERTVNKFLGFIVVCLTLAVAPAVANAAPAFVNGSFESDSWSTGSTNQVSPTGWVTVQATNDCCGNRFIMGVHNDVSTTSYHTPYGNQFIVVCGDDCSGGTYGSVSQTVSGFIPGQKYQLKFDQSPEFMDNFYVDVTIAGSGTLNQVFNANNYSGNTWADWKPQSWSFTADSSTLTFTFAGHGGGYESGIDNISLTQLGGVSSIPTLSQWGLILLSSLLVIGAVFTLRRRHQ